MLQTNQIYTATVDGFTSEGLGVCHIEGCAVFVPNAVPEETYQIRIEHIGKHNAFGKIESILTRSEHRINRRCPHAKQCGGCAFQHMDYEAELEIKRQRVYDALTRIGGVALESLAITGADTTDGYRNKVQFPVGMLKKQPVCGYYRAKSHEIIPVEHCLIQPECADSVRRIVMEHCKKFRIAPYDEASHTGVLRHIYVRCGAVSKQVLVCLVINGKKLPHANALVEALQKEVKGLTSVVLNINTKKTNVILGDEIIPIFGDGTIEDTLCGLKFRLSTRSFYQINHAQAERLYNIALNLADLQPNETALDLYCGTGTITLCLARHVKEVIGVEVIDAAIEDAKQNAQQNQIQNATFLCADASQAAQTFAKEGKSPDVIVVDPPRKGLTQDVITAIQSMSPKKLVYISCDPATCARDIKLLTNYKVETAQAVDLFPRCAHVETVVMLSHKKPDSVINVKVAFGEGEGKVPLDNIVKRAASYKPKERVTYKMIKEYIEAKYGFKVHTAYIAEVKRDLGLPMYDAPNAVEELKQPRKHSTAEKVQAIKDALKFFDVGINCDH